MKSFQRIALSLTCALVLCSCASVSPVMPAPVVQCPQLPPVPAAVMQERQVDFKSRMRNFLFN